MCTPTVTPLLSLLVGNRPHLEFSQHSLVWLWPHNIPLQCFLAQFTVFFDRVFWLLFVSQFWPCCIIPLLLIQTPFCFPPTVAQCLLLFNRNLFPYSDYLQHVTVNDLLQYVLLYLSYSPPCAKKIPHTRLPLPSLEIRKFSLSHGSLCTPIADINLLCCAFFKYDLPWSWVWGCVCILFSFLHSLCFY